MKMLKVILSECTGCNQCALTCAYKVSGTYDLTKSCIRVIQWEDICLSVPLTCQQCLDAPCIAVCPTESLARHPQTGAIMLNMETCLNCNECVDACRYQVMLLTEDQYPYTCDLCSGNPQCVAACYPGALQFVEVPDDQREPWQSLAQVLIDRRSGKNVPPPEMLRKEVIVHVKT